MKGLKVAMLSLHIYILFTISARMEGACRRMKVMDKVRKDRAFRLSHCLDSSVGLMATTPYPRRLLELLARLGEHPS